MNENEIKIQAIQSAVWLIRDVWDHGQEDNDYNRGFRDALDAMESLANHMES